MAYSLLLKSRSVNHLCLSHRPSISESKFPIVGFSFKCDSKLSSSFYVKLNPKPKHIVMCSGKNESYSFPSESNESESVLPETTDKKASENVSLSAFKNVSLSVKTPVEVVKNMVTKGVLSGDKMMIICGFIALVLGYFLHANRLLAVDIDPDGNPQAVTKWTVVKLGLKKPLYDLFELSAGINPNAIPELVEILEKINRGTKVLGVPGSSDYKTKKKDIPTPTPFCEDRFYRLLMVLSLILCFQYAFLKAISSSATGIVGYMEEMEEDVVGNEDVTKQQDEDEDVAGKEEDVKKEQGEENKQAELNVGKEEVEKNL